MKIKKKDLSFIKGVVKFDEPMSAHTTFKVGGPADAWILPRDTEDLLNVLRFAEDKDIDVFVAGGGSKILVSDKGIRGFVISLDSPGFKNIEFDDDVADLGCGIELPKFIRTAAERGLGGCEFLAGVPGKIGGAVMMNAGWPGKAIGELVIDVTAVKDLKIINLKKSQIKFAYRSSGLDDGFILLSARLEMERSPKDMILSQIKENLKKKKESQDLKYPSVGCIFKNPSADMSAGKIIEASGFKGSCLGGAQVSEKHANFIINRSSAKAVDIKNLIVKIQNKVFKERGVMLKLEVKFIGDF